MNMKKLFSEGILPRKTLKLTLTNRCDLHIIELSESLSAMTARISWTCMFYLRERRGASVRRISFTCMWGRIVTAPFFIEVLVDEADFNKKGIDHQISCD